MTRPDEALWVLRAQCGDREALERLLVDLQPALGRYLASLVGPADAEDLVQDVLLQVYRKLAWLRAPELFRPWAFRIASRRAFRHLRAKRRLPRDAGEQELDTIPAAAAPPTAGELAAIPAIAGVSPASRAVLNLHFQHDLTLAEVAVVLDIPLGTVRSRLAYGLAVLRKLLQEKEVDMTNEESLKDVRKALRWIDRRQIYGMVAAVLGYAAWLFSLGRLLTLVRGTTALPEDVRVVLEAAAIFVVLSAMATQFMICSYVTVLTRRVLRAIHLSADSRGV